MIGVQPIPCLCPALPEGGFFKPMDAGGPLSHLLWLGVQRWDGLASLSFSLVDQWAWQWPHRFQWALLDEDAQA